MTPDKVNEEDLRLLGFLYHPEEAIWTNKKIRMSVKHTNAYADNRCVQVATLARGPLVVPLESAYQLECLLIGLGAIEKRIQEPLTKEEDCRCGCPASQHPRRRGCETRHCDCKKLKGPACS